MGWIQVDSPGFYARAVRSIRQRGGAADLGGVYAFLAGNKVYVGETRRLAGRTVAHRRNLASRAGYLVRSPGCFYRVLEFITPFNRNLSRLREREYSRFFECQGYKVLNPFSGKGLWIPNK